MNINLYNPRQHHVLSTAEIAEALSHTASKRQSWALEPGKPGHSPHLKSVITAAQMCLIGWFGSYEAAFTSCRG